MKAVIIIEEKIEVGANEVADVDPMIIAAMRERLNPRKEFSYANNDHLKDADINEKRMRENFARKTSEV